MRPLLAFIVIFAAGALHAAEVSRKEPLPVTEEPYHRTVFENEVLRVIDVQIPPGVRCLFHEHKLPSVVVYLTKSTNKSQPWGENDEAKFLIRSLNAGESRYAPYDTQPLTHRVTNTGEGLFRVLDIELLHAKPATPPPFGKLPAGAASQWEEKLVRVVKIPLEPGATCTLPASTQSRLVVGISGTVSATAAKELTVNNLKWADHRFFTAQAALVLSNPGTEKAEALVLELN
jgi:hypothetical protein